MNILDKIVLVVKLMGGGSKVCRQNVCFFFGSLESILDESKAMD
jgi:hypothetical protein